MEMSVVLLVQINERNVFMVNVQKDSNTKIFVMGKFNVFFVRDCMCLIVLKCYGPKFAPIAANASF